MSQPQPCQHEFDEMAFCESCGQPAERVADQPEAFGTCWRGIDYGPHRQRVTATPWLYFKTAGVMVFL